MAHRLLTPPVRRMTGRARLPLIQRPSVAITRNLLATLQPKESLRLVKTSPTNKYPGPLQPIQVFTIDGPGGTNSPANMQEGLRVANSPNLSGSTRGQSAGT